VQVHGRVGVEVNVVGHVLAQRAAAVGVAQLQDGLGLDLADALARDLRRTTPQV